MPTSTLALSTYRQLLAPGSSFVNASLLQPMKSIIQDVQYSFNSLRTLPGNKLLFLAALQSLLLQAQAGTQSSTAIDLSSSTSVPRPDIIVLPNSVPFELPAAAKALIAFGALFTLFGVALAARRCTPASAQISDEIPVVQQALAVEMTSLNIMSGAGFEDMMLSAVNSLR